MRRCIAVLLVACGISVASAQYPTQDPDRVPSVTDPSVPLSYVGNNGSISLGINAEGETEGQLMGVFARNDARAVVGQLWWDRAGAGGAQFDFNWLWGGDARLARENPDQATVSRLSFALDQSAQHARKATLGFGIERRAFAAEGWLAHGVGGARGAGRSLQDDVVRVSGRDEVGDYTTVETTTYETIFESKPFGTEVGLQFSRVFGPWATRVYGAGSTQDGDGTRVTTLSLGVDTPLGQRGWGLAARADHVQRSGLDSGDDNRLAVFLRYEFGRHGSFVPTAQLDSPAWIARSLARPSSAHPRTVETYRRVRTRNVSVTRGPRQYSNRFPLAQADSVNAIAGMPSTIDVLANDSDPDGDSLTLVAVTAPSHGSAMIVGNTIVYTPVAGYSGADSFSYTVSDGRGGTATALVGANVGAQANRAPLARNDSATTPSAQPVTIAVLANDTDPDGDSLSIVAVGTPAHGSAVISGGDIVYTPAAGYIGSDSFSYTIEDGHGGSASAMVVVTVGAPANQPPIAVSDSVTVTAGTATTIAVLANDHDPDGDALTITWVGIPSHGSATVVGNAIVYTAAATAVGSDSFGYRITDGRGGVASARVVVNIVHLANQPPVAVDDAATTPAGTTVTVNVLANDSDPDGDPLTITAVGTPLAGTAAIVGNAIVYTSTNLTFIGTDRFSYTISDGHGGSATAFVTVTVTAFVNTPPVAVDDAANATNGASVTIYVLANDYDPDGDPLTITAVGTPTYGTATIVGNAIVYTSFATFTVVDSFTYTISDGHGGTATATVRVAVSTLVNTPPVAQDDAAATPRNTPIVIDVLANDSDPDGDPLAIIAVTQPANGTTTITANGILFTPNPTFFGGFAIFSYTISDGRGGTATAMVAVYVSG
ncbi:MAG: tandem-95 repeat protein [Dokdonella sp.]|uniref:Ig-like domain-containing protein n=1 Tax=Dokdonella sp. TaxID=2291710 RepID=UPI0025C2989A|nr:Ig-like domain-containing protein [Dokdonella sp.]MBX3700927.1 tandem-95 repeat protein [Dokdonella sp.]